MKQFRIITAASLCMAALSAPASAEETMAGKWVCAWSKCKPLGGPEALILNEDGSAVCINEQKSQVSGNWSKDTVTGCWGLTAKLSKDGKVLSWNNGSYWVR